MRPLGCCGGCGLASAMAVKAVRAMMAVEKLGNIIVGVWWMLNGDIKGDAR